MAQTLQRLAAVCLIALAVPAAAVTLAPEGCALYAVWSRDLLWARDVGADKGRVRASLIELADDDPSEGVFTLLLRDLDQLWLARAPRAQVFDDIYRDCVQRRGRYGTAA